MREQRTDFFLEEQSHRSSSCRDNQLLLPRVEVGIQMTSTKNVVTGTEVVIVVEAEALMAVGVEVATVAVVDQEGARALHGEEVDAMSTPASNGTRAPFAPHEL
uniref:Uncharacterized protein n=1 Tax=Salix viminalis TaxID=40686 RepID=A0A6N2KLS9_SALVM